MRPLVTAIAVPAVVWLLRELGSVLVPFIAALFLSYLGHPIVLKLQSWKVPRFAAVLLVMLLTLAAMAAFAFVVQNGLGELSNSFPRYRERLEDLRRYLEVSLGWSREAGPRREEVAKGAAAALGNALSLTTQIVLVYFYLLYLLIAQRYASAKWQAAFRPELAAKIEGIVLDVERQMTRYIWLQSLAALAAATYALVVLRHFGVESAQLWAMLTFLGQFIPTLGPIAASLPPIGLALLADPTKGLWVALWLLLGHTFVGYILSPPLFGKGMDLEPIAVLLGLVFFGWLWGIAGALLAVPLLVIVRIVCERVDSLKAIGALLKAHENQ
jgi:predicted PurR-regulated permease PerM